MNFQNVNNNKTILMDVFNTIVIRSIPDEKVKLLWAEQIVNSYKLNITPRTLFEERVSFERISSALSSAKWHTRQCEITWVLKKIWKKYSIHSSSLKEFLSQSRKIELEIELENDVINPEWLLWINKKNIKDIILVSDYYYGAEYLRDLLTGLGAPLASISDIFVSCEYHKTKKEGTLYSAVLATNHLDPSDCLMIGDNKQSDYLNAKSKGIDAILLDNEKINWPYCKPKDTQTYISKNFDDSAFQRISFLFYEFIYKLYNALKEKRQDTVLFFSREGEFLIQLFRAYQDVIGDHTITAHYFCVSRQATYLPSLKNYKEVDLNKYKVADGKISVDYLTYDLSIQEARQWREIFPTGYITEEEFQKSKDFEEVINAEIESQRVDFITYLHSFGVNTSKSFSIVDIGYLGKAQNHIYSLFHEEVAINGFYLFLMKSHYKVDERNKKYGLIFDEYVGDHQNCYCMNKGILEDILLASHGSTRKYIKDKGKVRPLFYDVPIEHETFEKYIQPVQEKILANFKMLAAVYYSTCSVPEDYARYHHKMYAKFIYDPSVEEMEIYSRIPHVQNYGKHTIEYPVKREDHIDWNKALFNIVRVFTTKGEIIRNQNARWLPLAFYILHLTWINRFLYLFSPITVSITDKDFKRRHKNL